MSEVHSTGALRQQPEAVGQDRELLELAALAAGITLVPYTWFKGTGWDHEGFTVAGEGPTEWNPLEDDGDALRLAVKLGLTVSASSLACTASHLKLWHVISEPGAPDIYAATRLAIVRAAAAIGNEIQQTASGSVEEARSNEQGEST